MIKVTIDFIESFRLIICFFSSYCKHLRIKIIEVATNSLFWEIVGKNSLRVNWSLDKIAKESEIDKVGNWISHK